MYAFTDVNVYVWTGPKSMIIFQQIRFDFTRSQHLINWAVPLAFETLNIF